MQARASAAASLISLASLAFCALPAAITHAAPGSPDLSFGPGLVVTPIVTTANGYSAAQAIAMDGNRIVLGGYCGGTGLSDYSVFCVSRHLPDGRLDTTFGGAGKVFTLIGNNANRDSQITAIAVQPDRKIVAVGECRSSADVRAICVARYNADGSLDGSFGSGGLVVTVVTGAGGATYTTYPSAIALQGDGKIVVTGICNATSTLTGADFCLVRYQSNGTLDPGFGTAGVAITPVSATSGSDSPYALLIQTDGRLVVAGGCEGNFCAARYAANGTLDTSFGSAGKLFITMSSGSNYANSLAQQADGKLLIAGTCNPNIAPQFCMARIALADGALDTSFGAGGKTILSLGSVGNQPEVGYTVLVQPDQRILFSGACGDGRSVFCSVRLLPDGRQADTSYGRAGVAKTAGRGVNVAFKAAVLQADGKLVQSGRCLDGQNRKQFCLVRYTTDGALDLSLNGGNSGSAADPGGVGGGSGAVYTAFRVGGEVRSIALQADGKAVLGGFCHNGTDHDFCLARYLSNGAPDTAFGPNGSGIVTTPIGADNDGGSVVLIQRDQKIILAGQCVVSPDNNDFCLARYLPNGTLDTSFGNGGKVITAIGAGNDGVGSAVIQFDGKIVLAGYCLSANGNYDFCLARYLSNGALDVSFNGTGKLLTDLSFSSDFADAVVQQPDGKLLVAGTCFTANNFDMCLARYLENGSLDLRFGAASENTSGSGMVSYPIGSGNDVGRSIALQPDGKIVVVGDCQNAIAPTLSNFCILRLLEHGTLDVPFGNNGTVFPTPANNAVAYAVAVQPDGKILLGGHCGASGDSSACVVRYNPDGSFDRTFGPTGTADVINRLSDSDAMYALALLPDGKILQAGTCRHDAKNEFCMARYEGGPFGYQACSLDIDGDGLVTPTVDNLIAQRVMRGMSGPAVIGGISFAPHARRSTWGDNTDRDIRRYLRTQCGMTVN